MKVPANPDEIEPDRARGAWTPLQVRAAGNAMAYGAAKKTTDALSWQKTIGEGYVSHAKHFLHCMSQNISYY
jgi:hypothetical protein